MLLKIKFSFLALVICLFLNKNQLFSQANYKEKIVEISSGGVNLAGTLTTPDNNKTGSLVILVAGSGPTDRDGNQPGAQNNSLKFIAEGLAEKGVSVFRYDKRAIGKSAIPNLDESKLRINDYANDLDSIIAYFKSVGGYLKIYILGHSEGSLIGLISLQKTKVDGFISYAGAGTSADVLLKEQLKSKLPENLFDESVLAIDSLKKGFLVKNFPFVLASLFRPSVQPYLISWFAYDPALLISKLSLPVLIIQGDKDIQVSVEDASLLSEANKSAKLIVVKNMNHIGKTIEGDMKDNIASYTNPNLPINQELIDSIYAFINQ